MSYTIYCKKVKVMFLFTKDLSHIKAHNILSKVKKFGKISIKITLSNVVIKLMINIVLNFKENYIYCSH